jgi:hypothetical protein
LHRSQHAKLYLEGRETIPVKADTMSESLIPHIQDYYINEVANKLGRLRPDERAEIKRTLKQIDEEEARGYASMRSRWLQKKTGAIYGQNGRTSAKS